MTYQNARTSCDLLGGQVFVPNSDEEISVAYSTYVQGQLMGIIGSSYVVSSLIEQGIGMWIGCTDELVEATFACNDGTQLDATSLWWADDNPRSFIQPAGSGKDCVIMQSDVVLFDDQCDGLQYTLCEVDPVSIVTQTAPQATTWTTHIPHESTTQSPPTQTTQQTQSLTAHTSPRSTPEAVAATSPAQIHSPQFRSTRFSLAKDTEGTSLIGYCLTDHVMKTLRNVRRGKCAMVCSRLAGCKSFNYKAEEGGICELNEEERNNVGSSFFIQSNTCSYFERI